MIFGKKARLPVVEHPDSDLHESYRQKLESVGPAPDGGFRAWAFVVLGMALVFNSWGIVSSFGTFQTYYKEELLSSNTNSAISWIGSVQGYLVNAASIFTGRAFDASYERAMMLTGVFLISFGLMMTSLSTEFYQVFLAQGICTGIGANLLFQCAVGIVSQYFNKYRPLALGILTSGSSFGGVVYPIVFRQLVPKIGFPWTVRVMGFMVFGASLGPALIMRNRLPARRSGPLIDIPSLTDVPYLLYCASLFFGFFAVYVPMFYIQSYALHIGVDSNMAPYLVSILNAGSIFGRIVPNFTSAKIGSMNTMIPSVVACLIMIFAWIRVDNQKMLIAFAAFYGFFSGSFVSMPPACISSMTSDPGILGTRIGMGFFVSSFGLLVGAPVGGALISGDHGGYLYAQICAGASICLSLALMCLARIGLTGLILQKKA